MSDREPQVLTGPTVEEQVTDAPESITLTQKELDEKLAQARQAGHDSAFAEARRNFERRHKDLSKSHSEQLADAVRQAVHETREQLGAAHRKQLAEAVGLATTQAIEHTRLSQAASTELGEDMPSILRRRRRS